MEIKIGDIFIVHRSFIVDRGLVRVTGINDFGVYFQYIDSDDRRGTVYSVAHSTFEQATTLATKLGRILYGN